jgi:hypothetical protein
VIIPTKELEYDAISVTIKEAIVVEPLYLLPIFTEVTPDYTKGYNNYIKALPYQIQLDTLEDLNNYIGGHYVNSNRRTYPTRPISAI